MYLRLIRLFTSFLLLGLLTVSCSGDDKDNEPPVPPTRTVIVYIAGENSLTDQMLNDVNEIKSGACQMKDGERIVLFTTTRDYPPLPYWIINPHWALKPPILSGPTKMLATHSPSARY